MTSFKKIDPFNVIDAMDPNTQEKILSERFQGQYYRNVINWFFTGLSDGHKSPQKVLEVGCGTGHVLDECCKKFCGIPSNYYGCDLSNRLIINASKIFPEYNFTCSDGTRLPFEDNYFDFAYAATVLVHASDPMSILHEMQRVLVKGGKIAILDQDFETAILHPGDKNLTREVLNAATDFWMDGWIGRKLPGMLYKIGVSNINISSFVRIDRKFDPHFFARIRDWIINDGFDKQKAEQWYTNLCENVKAQEFIFTRNFYSVSGVSK